MCATSGCGGCAYNPTSISKKSPQVSDCPVSREAMALANAMVLVDEACLLLHSRDSMSRSGRAIGPLINLSRQRKLSLIFIS